MGILDHFSLDCDDPHMQNSAERPDAVIPRRATGGRVQDDVLNVSLAPLSWNVIRLGAPQNSTVYT
ncbi:MAG: hypothetical protein H0U16_08840 [Actinobacteria bacterium]|nr:hypothetical protein [Actinomycetota bacterium]